MLTEGVRRVRAGWMVEDIRNAQIFLAHIFFPSKSERKCIVPIWGMRSKE